jgi:hypothetical protein
MPGTQTRDEEQASAFLPTAPQRLRYVVVRQQDAWFIMFKGEEFGPYRSEREAKLFAIDAAHELAEHGEETEVVMADETGAISPVWIHGQHAYPPRGQL